MVQRVQKIVSHVALRHMDDWLSVAFLVSEIGIADVEYIGFQDVPDSYINDKDIMLVDIGMSYDRALNNYDHHQDSESPCSFILIANDVLGNADIATSAVARVIDAVDRVGPFRAGVRLNRAQLNKRRAMTLIDPVEYAEQIADAYKVTADTSDFNLFIERFWDMLPEDARHIGWLLCIEERRRIHSLVQESVVMSRNGLKILMVENNVSPYESELMYRHGFDFIVQRISQNGTGRIKIAKDTSKHHAFSFESVFPEADFHHKSGFITVIDEGKIDVNCTVDRLLRRSTTPP